MHGMEHCFGIQASSPLTVDSLDNGCGSVNADGHETAHIAEYACRSLH